MSFYITLPSNSSFKDFPNNTLTKYTIRLKNPLRLDGNYEVALAQIIFPKNWKYREDGIIELSSPKKSFQIKVQFLVYETLSHIFERLNNVFMSTGIQAELGYNDETNRVYLSLAPTCKIKFNDNINEVFGFTSKEFVGFQDKTYSSDIKVMARINNINFLYIYSDICQYQIVGDTEAPLIQVVSAIENNSEFYIEKIFDSPHYIPLARNNLENITIDIRDDLGNPIQFDTGRVVVKLHFRKRNYYF